METPSSIGIATSSFAAGDPAASPTTRASAPASAASQTFSTGRKGTANTSAGWDPANAGSQPLMSKTLPCQGNRWRSIAPLDWRVMDPRPIGVFDSGMGGLTVLHECLVTLPHEDVVYLGDGARLPYGPRPLDEI